MKKIASKLLLLSLFSIFFLRIEKLRAVIPHYYFPSTDNLKKESIILSKNAYQLIYFGQFKEGLNLAKLAITMNKQDERLWLILSEAQMANKLNNEALFSLEKAEVNLKLQLELACVNVTVPELEL